MFGHFPIHVPQHLEGGGGKAYYLVRPINDAVMKSLLMIGLSAAANTACLPVITMFQGGNLRMISPYDQHLLPYRGGGKGNSNTKQG